MMKSTGITQDGKKCKGTIKGPRLIDVHVTSLFLLAWLEWTRASDLVGSFHSSSFQAAAALGAHVTPRRGT